MERIPAPGDLYRHFTDKIYQVIAAAVHAESGEPMIVYQEMSGDFGIFVMPLAQFEARIDKEKYPQASQQYLFEKIERAARTYQKPEMNTDLHGNKPETNRTEMQRLQSETTGEQESGTDDKRLHVQNTAESRLRVQNTAEHRLSVQRPADSKRMLSQETAVAAGGGAYYEKRRRQMEEREQRRGMFRKMERHETATEELHANPSLLKFLEADTYEERFHVLNQIQDEITDRLIDDMAVVLDVVIPEGALSDRFQQLKDVILTRQKYEINRLR